MKTTTKALMLATTTLLVSLLFVPSSQAEEIPRPVHCVSSLEIQRCTIDTPICEGYMMHRSTRPGNFEPSYFQCEFMPLVTLGCYATWTSTKDFDIYCM